jgi:hypothetical protein
MAEEKIDPLEKILIALAGFFSIAGAIITCIYISNWSFAAKIWSATAGLLWILVFCQGQRMMMMRIKIQQLQQLNDKLEEEERNWRITSGP